MDIEINDTVQLRDGRMAVVNQVSIGWVEGHKDKAENIVQLEMDGDRFYTDASEIARNFSAENRLTIPA